MAGDSNIIHWLNSRDFEPTEELVGRIRAVAKATNRVLEEDEVLAIING